MPSVRLKDNEDIEIAMRRFKRACEKSGILAEVRKRAAYEKPTSVRKRKAAAAVKRYRKKIEKETLQAKELRDRRKSAKNKAAASGPGNKNFRDKKSSDRYSRD